MMRRALLALGIAVLVPILSGRAALADDTKKEDTKKEDTKKVQSGNATIPVFRLRGELHESPADDTFSFSGSGSLSLKDLVSRLSKAERDPEVKAVVLLSEGGSVGSAQKEELRQVIAQLRSAGKEIYVHADSLSMSEYVLMSGASRLSVVPTADLWITGLHGESPYVRGLLDWIGVKPDFLTCGAYKSASEIFMRTGPSPEAEAMQNWLLDSIYDTYVKLIAKGRGVDADKVKSWINNAPYSAEKAKAAGLVDAVEHRQAFEEMLKSKYGKEVVFDKKYGKKQSPKFALKSPLDMFKMMGDLFGDGQKSKNTKNAVGIVYVDGPIMLGSASGSPFAFLEATSSDIRKALDEAARDDSVKAVVLRVNSPGGSAVASEIILDATRRVKAKKPFVVSMGDVAGSGGYYVACGSDVIFADEATITGSIGVVGGKLATNAMWSKIGVTFKEYKRGENAGLLSTNDVFSKSEREKMQAWMDEVYGVFKGHVETIRGNRLKKPIDELAGGRVYTGRQALELGLVDKIGTMQDAVKHVAGEAKLKNYDIRVIPEPKSFIEKILEELLGDKEDSKGTGVEARLSVAGRQNSLVEMALPYLQHLDPQRVSAIKMALQRLQMIQEEGVILMMPEFSIRQ